MSHENESSCIASIYVYIGLCTVDAVDVYVSTRIIHTHTNVSVATKSYDLWIHTTPS